MSRYDDWSPDEFKRFAKALNAIRPDAQVFIDVQRMLADAATDKQTVIDALLHLRDTTNSRSVYERAVAALRMRGVQ